MMCISKDTQRAGRTQYGAKASNLHSVIVHLLFVLLVTNSSVVQRDTHGTTVVSVVLPDDALAVQLP